MTSFFAWAHPVTSHDDVIKWKHFRVTGPLCGESGEFPSQRPVTRSFDVFFYLRLNKQLSKQSWGWWSETPSRSSWRRCNVLFLTRESSPFHFAVRRKAHSNWNYFGKKSSRVVNTLFFGQAIMSVTKERQIRPHKKNIHFYLVITNATQKQQIWAQTPTDA